MSSYGRNLMIGFVVGPMVLLGFFAWSLATVPASPDENAMASPEVGGLDEMSEELVVSSAAVSSEEVAGEATTSGLRPLPRAEGLPEQVMDMAVPTGIRITDIGVDGIVVPVGVESDGSFEVPSVRRVGWYRFGSNAGDPGSTVLAAHISSDGVDGVFRHLDSVRPGTDVELTMSDGAVVDYRIVEIVEYNKVELPVEELFSETGDDRLALITCGGTFNRRLRSYDSNVVAYAEPVSG